MDLAIVLAVVAGIGWACNIVYVRGALQRTSVTPWSGAVVGVTVAAITTLALALASQAPGPSRNELVAFAVVGAIAPGSSQGLFVSAIGRIGPARTSVLIGTSPIFSVALAIVFLGESWVMAIVAGTIISVAGGVLISWESGRLAGGWVGIMLALATALSFAIRDVAARAANTETTLSALWAAAIVLSAAAVVLALTTGVVRRRRFLVEVKEAAKPFVVSGLFIAFALTALLEALDRGRVGLVAPLSLAAQNIAVVVIASRVFGRSERTPRILVAIVLIIVGSALVLNAPASGPSIQ